MLGKAFREGLVSFLSVQETPQETASSRSTVFDDLSRFFSSRVVFNWPLHFPPSKCPKFARSPIQPDSTTHFAFLANFELPKGTVMPPFLLTCKPVGSIVTRKNWKRHVIKPASSYRQLQNCDQIRCLGCIAGVEVPSIHRPSDANKDVRILGGGLHSGDAVQTRRFLGCGDGEEGGALSKVYEERRVLGYSPVQLFDVVAAVDLYQDFCPLVSALGDTKELS